MIRKDKSDLVFLSEHDKFQAILEDIQDCVKRGQPVLVGTTSIETSERLAKLLQGAKIPHEVLNAKQHEREAHIVAEAGRPGAITIATNMAGRGTDIVLGGSPQTQIDAIENPNEGELKQIHETTGASGTSRCWPPAACTSSAPSAMNRGASTISCAADPAARAIPARAVSTCRSKII